MHPRTHARTQASHDDHAGAADAQPVAADGWAAGLRWRCHSNAAHIQPRCEDIRAGSRPKRQQGACLIGGSFPHIGAAHWPLAQGQTRA
jgi:hypothetical protein